MIIKTKDFNETVNVILMAVDNNAANLELVAKDNILYLNVTNKEYFCSCKFALEEATEFRAVVDAKLFLNLISGITAETFDLSIKDNSVVIKVGKSNYKLSMIFENDQLMVLQPIILATPTVDMTISNDILKSILNVNGKELIKAKNLDLSELQKLYYITEEGCFNFTTGACLNSFNLEKPIKLLLNDRIVKLFKLFKDDVKFSFGHDDYRGIIQTKVVFQTETVYLAALITNDDLLLNKVQGPYLATKNYINENYSNRIVLSVKAISSAISRLLLFAKNSLASANMFSMPATFVINGNDLMIKDGPGNEEFIQIENKNPAAEEYSMIINLADLKLILDSCREDFITLNCGNHKSVVVTRGNIANLIPEGDN